MNINEKLVEKLKVLKAGGANANELLEEIKVAHQDDGLIKPLGMKYFRESFGLSMSDVIPIGGWCGFGGELSNEQICKLLDPCFEE